MSNILITGATGSVGFNLLRKLLEETNDFFYLLVRPNTKLTSDERIYELLKNTYDDSLIENYKKRLKVISGNLTETNFSLDKEQIEELIENIEYIYHCAASISFTLPLEKAREINITGTKNVLNLAEQCLKFSKLKRIFHVSTSYVLGNYTKVFLEDQLDVNQGFNNTYEQSKFETEVLLQKYISKDFPLTIFRPSIIGSDSVNGEITKSNIIFDFIKRISQGRLTDVICDDDSSLNIIPMDFVINTLFKISQSKDSIGETYHLANNYNLNVKNFVEYVCRASNAPMPNLVSISDKDNADRFSLMRLTPFLPYISQSHRFDNSKALSFVDEESKPQKLGFDYVKKCIEYCKEYSLI